MPRCRRPVLRETGWLPSRVANRSQNRPTQSQQSREGFPPLRKGETQDSRVSADLPPQPCTRIAPTNLRWAGEARHPTGRQAAIWPPVQWRANGWIIAAKHRIPWKPFENSALRRKNHLGMRIVDFPQRGVRFIRETGFRIGAEKHEGLGSAEFVP